MTMELCLTVPPCPYPLETCTEFAYHRCCHFENGAKRKIDDVLLKDGGLPYGLPLAVHLHSEKFFGGGGGWWPTGF